jgi:hypothetical protein
VTGTRTLGPADGALRPGFAQELLWRLAQDDGRRALGSGVKKVAAGALGGATVTASVALLLASRRKGRR